MEFRVRVRNPQRNWGRRCLFFQCRGLGFLRLKNRDLTLPSIREQDQGSSSLTNGAQGLLFPKSINKRKGI